MANPLSQILSLITPDNNKIRTFDPKQLIVTFGPIIMSGFAPSSFISIEPDGDYFRVIRGTGGDTERIKIGSGNCIVTISLLQTTPINDLLTTAHLSDVVGNAGVFPLIIKDMGGTQLFMSMKAYIVTPPAVDFSNEVSERKWRFYCPEALNYVGGTDVLGL